MTLADVARVVGGSTPSSSVREYWNGDILWVRTPTDLSALEGRAIEDCARKITQQGFASAGLEMLPGRISCYVEPRADRVSGSCCSTTYH